MTISLRPASSDDQRQIFAWRNDPFILARSTSQREVSWEEHQTWFAATLRNADRMMYVVSHSATPIGVVRFDRDDGDECVISAYLMQEFTGRGWGAQAIREGCRLIRGQWQLTRVIAHVRADNTAGMSGFLKSGFVQNAFRADTPAEHVTLVQYAPDDDRQAWRQDDQLNIDYYAAQAKLYGVDSRSLNWGSRQSQQLRFRVLTEVAPLVGRRILDVGCGLGDLYDWLLTQDVAVEYAGVDIVPKFISMAQERFGAQYFSVRNLLDEANDIAPADIVVASGIFAKRQGNPMGFLQTMVTAMFARAGVAVAFNSLSSAAKNKEAGEFYADPVETFRFCRTLTPWVSLRQDYHANDFTIYLYKDRNQ
ncbi:GNAT family N-acetyltransferase [Herbaspirillum lusitanum]|uniref:GNAT family N-acetyltransferase n=1 Tax=Herbaspirillum lusitanum TaxID=213312 RepID=UPI0022375FCF|nr:GNAT family N-acetyltransferase [Herbaspirillum lusitanum]MCW5300589.1 GNAT family N-acetyltransferase [Herbaspirillum lusitanum]